LVDQWHDRTTDAAAYLAWVQGALQKAPAAAPAPASSSAAPASIDLPQLTTLAGAPVDTSKFSGKVVVVNFWATWCVPCVGELPTFNKIHHDLGPKGVAVIGIDTVGEDNPDTAEKVTHFLTRHPIDYPLAMGTDALATKYKIETRPVTIVFDRSGKEIKRFDESLTEKDLLAAVQKAL
jgi:thiol-disulfide isomerase/thioredoxin